MGSCLENKKGANGSSIEHHRGSPRRCHVRLRPHARAGERNHGGAIALSPFAKGDRRSGCSGGHRRSFFSTLRAPAPPVKSANPEAARRCRATSHAGAGEGPRGGATSRLRRQATTVDGC
jgi:hypothetical protein